MTLFTVIEGGNKKSNKQSPQTKKQTLNNIKLHINHIESFMAVLKKQSRILKIPHLDNCILDVHKSIVKTLKVIKEENKKEPYTEKQKLKLVKSEPSKPEPGPFSQCNINENLTK